MLISYFLIILNLVRPVSILTDIDLTIHICFIVIFLSGDSQSFLASDSDPGLIKTINTLSPVSYEIQLKVGAQVD